MQNYLMTDKKMSSRDWGVDAGVAAAAFLFGCLQLLLAASSMVFRDDAFRSMMGYVTATPTVWAYAILALTTWPLVLRRKFPWPVLVFTFLVYVSVQVQFRGFSLSIVGPMVALFSVTNMQSRKEAVLAAALSVVGVAIAQTPALNMTVDFYMRVQNIFFMVTAALAGFALRAYQDYVDEAQQRAHAAEESRDAEAARRVEEERVRIAREVHDITAHSLSAVSIQAAAAEKLIDTNPVEAKHAISQVRATSRSALEEIRSMIGVLRNEDAQAETVPTEGTDRLGDVDWYLRDAGLQVKVNAAGYDKSHVPAYIDVALFGIIREAATNIVRHAQAQNVSIMLWTDDDATVHVSIEDDGCGIPDEVSPQSHGLQGMKERVMVLNGAIDIGASKQGGTRIMASIPLAQGAYNG